MAIQRMVPVVSTSIELGPLPFNLHIRDAAGRMVLYGRKGVIITPELRETILRSGKPLFITDEEVDSYLTYTLGHVKDIVCDESVGIHTKTNILRDAGRKILVKISQNQVDAQTVGYSKQLTTSVVDLILGSPNAYESLLSIAGQKDYLFEHALNTCTFCLMIGQRLLDVDDVQLFLLGLGGLMLDIGMATIDKDILNKPGALTKEERTIVETHPKRGYETLAEYDVPKEVLAMVLQHHERMDGSGYPVGFTGADIDNFAAIAAVADVYDALTSDRSFRRRMDPVAALDLMLGQKHAFHRPALETLMRIVLKNEELVAALLSRSN